MYLRYNLKLLKDMMKLINISSISVYQRMHICIKQIGSGLYQATGVKAGLSKLDKKIEKLPFGLVKFRHQFDQSNE